MYPANFHTASFEQPPMPMDQISYAKMFLYNHSFMTHFSSLFDGFSYSDRLTVHVYVCVLLPKVEWSAFTQASFSVELQACSQ